MQQVLSCGFTSARVDISCRFANFLKSLRNSTSMEVQVLSRFLARDVQSVTGKNIQLLFELTGLNPWTAYQTRLRDALVARARKNIFWLVTKHFWDEIGCEIFWPE